MRVEPLDLMYYTSGYKYQLRTDCRFRLPPEFAPYSAELPLLRLVDCILTCKAGYATDGPSGWTVDTKNSMRGALMHDAGYQLIREGVLPREFKQLLDDLFRELLQHDGMSAPRSFVWHRGVAVGGYRATIHNKNVMVAP